MSNPFFAPDHPVDDEEFLSHSRTGSGGYMLSNQASGYSTGGYNGGTAANGYEERSPHQQIDPLQQLLERKREIEQRTLDSSNRSVGLLYESEKTGAATAEELHRQKEQLKRTEERLMDVNSTLKASERHLQGIKSVFGGLKNYFRGRPAATVTGKPSTDAAQTFASDDTGGMVADRLNSMRDQSHPGLRVRGQDEGGNSVHTSEGVDDALDRNLDEMSMGLSRLKGLARDLNQELDDHNDIIERIDNEAAFAGLKIGKQNRDMDKLLKKK